MMSISPSLTASARSAYRNLYRAANATFSGDDRVLRAFRAKMRSDALQSQSLTDPVVYQQQIQLAREIADVLRRNVVQAEKVSGQSDDERETWRIRMTRDTELGDNESIKNPPPMGSNRRKKEEAAQQTFISDAALHKSDTSKHPALPVYYSTLKKAHQQRKVPELREEDIEEAFVRGSGPGGQSINKTENNVQLLHKPTGIRVACQETRSLIQNRMLARRHLLEKLDRLDNPGLSKGEMRRAKVRERERRRRKKAKKKAQKQVEVDDG